MNVRFWGVRGSIAVSGPRYLRTGGNTPCIELCSQGNRLILDAGTGLRALGDSLGFVPIDATILMSHVHWDHIQGVPFFAPAYHPGSRLTFAGAERDSGSIADALQAQMKPPNFPVGLETLAAKLDFLTIEQRVPFELGPFTIRAADLDHPDGVHAYRIEAEGKTVVLATDVEHGDELDPRLLSLAEGADLLIHDAQYTVPEYLGAQGPCRRGWGHSTWVDAVQVGRKAGVRRLALFHHDPNRDDDQVAVIESEALACMTGVFAAREGGVLSL